MTCDRTPLLRRAYANTHEFRLATEWLGWFLTRLKVEAPMQILFQKYRLSRTPANRYRQILQRVDDLTPPTPKEIQTYFAQLRFIASMLPRERCRFQLEGGMSLALHCGGFTRRHGDVDISILEDALPVVADLLADNGYGLFSRNAFHAFEYAPWDLLEPLTAKQILGRKRVKRLTAVKLDSRVGVGRNDSLLPRFDLHIHRDDGQVVWLERGSVAFPRDLFFSSRVFNLDERCQINLASLALTFYYKVKGKRLRHRRDLDLIEKHEQFTAESRERTLRVLGC